MALFIQRPFFPIALALAWLLLPAGPARAGSVAVTTALDRIHLVEGGQAVDFGGAPSSAPVGTAPALDWSPVDGRLFAFAGTTVWENDGGGWTAFADLSPLGIASDPSSDLAIDPSGRIAVTDTLDRIFLVDATGAVVDMGGAPTTAHVGTAPSVDWDPLTGHLFAWGGHRVWEHDGSTWGVFADVSGFGIRGDTSADLSFDAAGRLAIVDELDRIFLLDRSGNRVDFAGAPTSGHVGVAPAVDFDRSTGHLFAWGASRVWELDESGWSVAADLAGAGISGDTTSRMALAPMPEPSTALLLAMGLTGLAARRRRRAA